MDKKIVKKGKISAKPEAGDPKPKVLVILGPTAAGKTGLAVKLAAVFNGEVVSADSRQVYKGMDIGTGKDLEDYSSGKEPIPYHLIDVVEPTEPFDLAEYCRQARAAIDDILKRGRLPIVCGGSGLYLQALVDNYQLSAAKPDRERRTELEALSVPELFARLSAAKPEFAARLNNSDKNNKRRLVRYLEIAAVEGNGLEKRVMPGREEKAENLESSPYEFLLFGVDYPDDVLKKRIEKRLKERLEAGMAAEVERLHDAGVPWERLESFGLEYRFVSRYLRTDSDYDDMVEKLGTAIYRFAKRQKVWFKRWQKQGREVDWVPGEKEAEARLRAWLES